MLACLFGWCPSAAAVSVPLQDSEDVSLLVEHHSQGLRFGLTPALLISPRYEALRFAFGADLRYGFVLPRVIIAPGIRLGAVLLTPPRVFTSFATVRFTFPKGRFGPYVIGGVGGGYTDRPSPGVLGGCGFMVHFKRFAAGLEATFQNLFNTPYQVATIGPQLMLAF
jgi:hypothetical protein